MKNLTLFTGCLLFCFLVFCGCTFGEKKENALTHAILINKITIGVKCDSKPFGFIDNQGNIQGFDVDIAKNITNLILGDENSLELVCVSAQSRIADLNSKKVDLLVAAMSITDNRANVVRFSTPYYIAGQAIMTKNNSKIAALSDLNKANVGFILGTTSERTIRNLAPAANLRASKTYFEIFELLKDDEIDAILADDSILYGILMDNNGYKILPKRYTREYYAVATRQNKESNELFEEVNNAINIMQQRGIINEIKAKWIPNLHS